MTATSSAVAQLPKSKPDLRQAMQLFGRELLAALACAQTGTIQSFDPDKQLAEVAFTADMVVGYKQSQGGTMTPVTKPYPLLGSVPVMFLGGNGAALTFPIVAGDNCLLVFLDRDSDVWLTSGQTGMAPNTNRLHALSDAIAIVGLRPGTNPLAAFSATDAQLYGPDGATGPIVSLGEGKVRVANNGGSLFTCLSDLMTSLGDLISTLKAWEDTHGDTPNPATIAALNNVQTEFDNVNTEIGNLLKV